MAAMQAGAISSTDVYIALMGMTGVGKSRFISQCSSQDVKIGHNLESCTSEVGAYHFQWQGRTVHMVDTPGFDDTNKSDREVLEDIASWLGATYQQRIKLSAILYLHRIIDPRVAGSSKRNLAMFRNLCGEDFYPRVTLVTSFWDEIEQTKGENRLRQLISGSDLWATMVDRGAIVERHTGDTASASRILTSVLQNLKLDAPDVLKVQREMVDQKMNLHETSAGMQFETELVKLREQHVKDIAQLRQDAIDLLEMKEIQFAREAEKKSEVLEARVKQSMEDQAQLRVTLEDIQRRQAQDLERLQEEAEEQRANYEMKLRDLRKTQSRFEMMDESSLEAVDLKGEVERQESDLMKEQANMLATEQDLRTKVKRLAIQGKDWMKANPDLTKSIAKYGMQVVAALASAQAGRARHDAWNQNSATTPTDTFNRQATQLHTSGQSEGSSEIGERHEGPREEGGGTVDAAKLDQVYYQSFFR